MTRETPTESELLSAADAVGVLHDLASAMLGTNGYGGDVAEIYACRLLPPTEPGGRLSGSLPGEREMAIAGRNLTWLAKQFIEMVSPDVRIGIEIAAREFRDVDLDAEPIEPFGHRVHIRVTSPMKLRGIPMLLWCPACHVRHIDRGEFETRPHAEHACQGCGLTWMPALVPTVGVQFLPGYKDVDDAVGVLGLDTLTFATRRGRGTLVISAGDAALLQRSQTHPEVARTTSDAPIKCGICGDTGPAYAPCPTCGAR